MFKWIKNYKDFLVRERKKKSSEPYIEILSEGVDPMGRVKMDLMVHQKNKLLKLGSKQLQRVTLPIFLKKIKFFLSKIELIRQIIQTYLRNNNVSQKEKFSI